jgi:hypothetical protein
VSLAAVATTHTVHLAAAEYVSTEGGAAEEAVAALLLLNLLLQQQMQQQVKQLQWLQ